MKKTRFLSKKPADLKVRVYALSYFSEQLEEKQLVIKYGSVALLGLKNPGIELFGDYELFGFTAGYAVDGPFAVFDTLFFEQDVEQGGLQ